MQIGFPRTVVAQTLRLFKLSRPKRQRNFHKFSTPLRTCADRTEHVQRRVRSLLTTFPIARPCGRSCAPPSPVRRPLVRATPSFFLNVVPTCFCRRRRFTATASGTHHFVEASLPRECLTTSPGRWRLARGTDFLSPLRCLACVAVQTQCRPRPGSCPSPCQWRVRR